MENKKDFKILYVGEGKKKMEYNPIYLYSQNLNVIRPFDEAYREINEIAFKEIEGLIPKYLGKKTIYTINPEYDFSLSIFPADCQSAAIYDYKKKIKALVHSGWRGCLKEIIPKTILEFLLRGSKIENIRVILGPMLLKEHFEIKGDHINDFREYIKGLKSEKKIISYNIAKDCYNIDLLEIILHQLKNIGIRKQNINLSLVEDTYSAVDKYQNLKYRSYRRDKDDFRNICLFI